MAGVCSTPGCPQYATGLGQCDQHRSATNRRQHRTVPTKATRTHAERRRRAQVVAAWRARHGDWCPADGGHHAVDLTADHPTPIAAGGDPQQELAVLCRSHNSSKGARHA